MMSAIGHFSHMPGRSCDVRYQGMNRPRSNECRGFSLTRMYGPAVRRKKISSNWRLRSCINVSGL
jgi:hypothetical protein